MSHADEDKWHYALAAQDESEAVRIQRVLGPRIKGSRDLVKQFVLDTTREVRSTRAKQLRSVIAKIIRWL